MKLIEVKDLDQLTDLYNSSAMTWEGLNKEDFLLALGECCVDGRDGTGYLITGKTMNELCQLTGSNAYQDDLNIFCIKDFKGLAMLFGARWLDDIIDNNAHREGFHPIIDLDK